MTPGSYSFQTFHGPDPRESRARDEQEVYSQRMKESLSGASPSLHSSSLGHSSSQLRPSDLSNPRSLSSVVHHDLHEWKLKTDEGLNSYIRDEFFYEQVWVFFSMKTVVVEKMGLACQGVNTSAIYLQITCCSFFVTWSWF